MDKQPTSSPPSWSLPEKPSKYPTPHISDTEITDYLLPLYAVGWRVSFDRRASTHCPSLTKEIRFKGFKAAIRFINKAADIINLENHHPQIVIDYSRVTLSSQTHSAVSAQSKEQPGITIRDARLAMLIEELLRNEFAGKAEAVEPPSDDADYPMTAQTLYGSS